MGENNSGFTNEQSPQGGAFSRDLLDQKSKSPLFPGPGGGAAVSNDWCIMRTENSHESSPMSSGICSSAGDCFSIDFVMSESKLSNRTLNLASSVFLVLSNASL